MLELMLYQGRLQLATVDALYSDGSNYRPATATLKHLKRKLNRVHSVLVLGTGLGSIVHNIHRMGHKPSFTLVEYDKVVLDWAIEFMGPGTAGNITPVCMDGRLFMASNKKQFDLVFIDIFINRVVPAFVTTIPFMSQCREALNPGGHVAFNYMIDDPVAWINVQKLFALVFPDHEIIDLGINRVFIGRVAAS